MNDPFKATSYFKEITKCFKYGMPVGKHWRNFKAYENCFSSSAAVDWLLDFLIKFKDSHEIKRWQALQLLQTFQNMGIIEDVRGSHFNKAVTDDGRLLRFKTSPSLFNSPVRPSLKTIPNGCSPLSDYQCAVNACSSTLVAHFKLHFGNKLDGAFEKLDSVNIYSNVSQDIEDCFKSQSFPSWFIECFKYLAEWPASKFQFEYPGFIRDLLALLFEHVNEHYGKSFSFVNLLPLFEHLNEPKQIQNGINKSELFLPVNDKNFPFLDISINESRLSVSADLETNPLSEYSVLADVLGTDCITSLLNHFQYILLLLETSLRPNIVVLFSMLNSVCCNEKLIEEHEIVNSWVTNFATLFFGVSHDQYCEWIFRFLIQNYKKAFKVPRILRSIFKDKLTTKQLQDANTKTSNSKSKLKLIARKYSCKAEKSLARTFGSFRSAQF